MLLMHGPAPAEFRSPQSRSSPARSRATNEKRTAPLASSSPVRTRVSSEIQLEPGKKSPPLTTTRAFRQLQVVKHTKYSVALSHWHSLSDFFVQLGMHSKLLNELTDRLTEAFQYNYSMQRSVYSSSPMCMAKWDGDQNWYRAELLDGEGLVLFVDFGNLAVVRRRDALRDLPQLPLLIDTEALAIRCSLAGLRLLPGVDDVNDLSHPDGQSLRDWFKNSLSTCDIIFTGSVFDETRQVVLVDQADGKLLSERIARRYPHAFALEESAISLPQSLIGSECNGSAGESSSADETKSMSPSDGDRCSSQMGDEEAQEQDSDLWQFNVNDFIDAKITYLDSTKMDMAFVQPAHMIEKQASVTVACRQECSIAPQPHASAFIPGAKLVFQDPHDKQYYRAILIKPKSDEGVSFKLFLMDVGRFEAFQPSQVREMPACVVDTDPLAMRVQLRRRPLQLAVDDHVVLVLATADAIPVVDVFRDYDDYIAAKENSERNNAHNSLNSLHQQDHPRRIEIGTQSREQDSRQIVDNGATRQGSSASERLDGKKGNQPSEGSKPNEVRVIQKVAQMEPTEREAIIRRAPSTILPTIVQSNEEGEHSITAATVRNGTDTPSNAVGTNNKLTSAAFVPIILPCNNSILKPIANGTIAAGEPTMTKLRVPPLTLSSGDSLLVHLEIESLVNDPHDFVLTKDCGSEFPLLLDDMNSRDKTPMMDVRVGDHCVFVDRSGRIVQYHRVEVVETNEATHTVKARRLDHGGALNDVHMNDLVDLAPDDVRMARVAIRCRLNSDYYNLADWDSSEVRQCLRKYALMTSCRQHLLLRAHVAAFDGGVATVQLHTRNDSSDVITEALCSARQRRTADQRVAANPSSTIFA